MKSPGLDGSMEGVPHSLQPRAGDLVAAHAVEQPAAAVAAAAPATEEAAAAAAAAAEAAAVVATQRREAVAGASLRCRRWSASCTRCNKGPVTWLPPKSRFVTCEPGSASASAAAPASVIWL